MIVAAAVLCGVLGVWVGIVVNLLVDLVPKRISPLPLRTLCASCADPGPDDDGGAPGPAVVGRPERPRAGSRPERPRAGSRLAAVPWLLRGGRCPSCGAGVPARYAIVEVVTGGLFAATVLRFGADAVIPAYLVFFTALVAISTIDLDLHIIPNRIVYPTIFAAVPLLALAAAANGDVESLRDALLGGALAFAALFVIHLVSPAGMGFGDVRLAFVLGLFLGWLSLSHVLVGVFLGFLLGALIGLALVLLRVRTRKDAIPFGPFLAGGAALAVFVGSPIIQWWLHP